MSSPTADVSCRVAWVDDAPAIARVQLRARAHDLASLLPQELLEVDEGQVVRVGQRPGHGLGGPGG